MSKIFMISGLTDIERAGNQSFRNSILYLSRYGHELNVFTFMPDNYPNLQDPDKTFDGNVSFHRLPSFLSYVVNISKRIKDLLGKLRQGNSKESETGNGAEGAYLREYNSLGRIFYIIFLFCFYLPIEFVRVISYGLRSKPDLFYGVNCQGAFVASLAGRLFNKPVITRFHGASITEYDISQNRNRLLLSDEIAGMRCRTNAVVMTNDGTRGEKILRLLGVEESKIHFWINGLNVDHFDSFNDEENTNFKKSLGIEGKRVLLMVSRLAAWKRVERGISCMVSLVKKYSLKDAVLLIVGDGPERPRLEKQAELLGITEFVVFCGAVKHQEINKYFNIADIFLSLYDLSNLSNPLLEAMYFGLPVITIEDGSTEGFLQDAHNAVLISATNIEKELPAKVARLLYDDGQLTKQMGDNARRTFDEKVFSWDKRMKLEDALIGSILDPVSGQKEIAC